MIPSKQRYKVHGHIRGEARKKFNGVIPLNSPMSFRISKSIAAFTKEKCKFSLVSYDTIQYMLAPPLGHMNAFYAVYPSLYSVETNRVHFR
jgi:hypothetical protein